MPLDRAAPAATPANLSSRIALPLAQFPELKAIYDSAPIGLAFLSPDCRYLQVNQRLTEICGISVGDHLGRTVRETVPALAEAIEGIVASIMRTGEPVTGVEVAGQRADEINKRSWVTYWHPLRAANGEILGVNVAAEEITERKRADAALRASELQFHTLADAIPQLVWMAESDGGVFWFNSRWYDYTGLPRGEIGDWKSVLDEASLIEARRRWTESAPRGAAIEMEVLLRGKDGEFRPFLSHVVPLRNSYGHVYRWIGTHIDISEQRKREEHVRFVSNELSHRTKNLLAVVLAVSRQTARGADDVAQYQARFVERLTALAQSHDLLLKDDWQGASFADLVAAQMKPFGEVGEDRIHASGPAITLRPDAVQNLGLAFHELATNASKHGALSVAHGEVSVSWLLDATTGRIVVQWREHGGPPVQPPRRRGFGHLVIERIVPKALKGNGALDFSPLGVNWTFEFPAASG